MSAQIVVISCGSQKPLSRTLAPLAASARAIPRPIPLVDPVTMADLPTSIFTGAIAGIVLAALNNIAHPFHLLWKRTKAGKHYSRLQSRSQDDGHGCVLQLCVKWP